MADEDEEFDIDPEDTTEEADEKYQDIRKTASAPRNIDLPEDEEGRSRSYTASQEETSKLSDMQATFRLLAPQFSIRQLNEISHSIMLARIFPQNFRPLFKKIVVMIMRENPSLDPEMVQVQVNSMMTIGYDGRFRVEAVEVAGVMGEDEGFAMGNSMLR